MKPRPSEPRSKPIRFLVFNITVFLTVMLFSCGNPTSVIQQLASDDTLSGVVAYDIVFFRSDSGYVQVKLTAPMMSQQGSDTSFVEFPQGFHALVFDKNRQVASEISADYGINHTDTKVVEAIGNVSVENQQNGQCMYSDKLYWYQDTKMIYTRSKVRIVTPDKDVTGDSLEAYENFDSYTIYNGKATFEVEDE